MQTLIFSLGDKEYGADLSDVSRVIRARPATPVPDTAAFVEGVIALRGRVLPLIDLAVKLGMPRSPKVMANRIIIARVDGQSVGLRVDKVTEVLALGPEKISPPGAMLQAAPYLTGIARIGERLILIVNLSRLLQEDLNVQVRTIQDHVEVRAKR